MGSCVNFCQVLVTTIISFSFFKRDLALLVALQVETLKGMEGREGMETSLKSLHSKALN